MTQRRRRLLLLLLRRRLLLFRIFLLRRRLLLRRLRRLLTLRLLRLLRLALFLLYLLYRLRRFILIQRRLYLILIRLPSLISLSLFMYRNFRYLPDLRTYLHFLANRTIIFLLMENHCPLLPTLAFPLRNLFKKENRNFLRSTKLLLITNHCVKHCFLAQPNYLTAFLRRNRCTHIRSFEYTLATPYFHEFHDFKNIAKLKWREK